MALYIYRATEKKWGVFWILFSQNSDTDRNVFSSAELCQYMKWLFFTFEGQNKILVKVFEMPLTPETTF